MNWRKPEELPDANEVVWVLIQHWKEAGPLSCEIYCGEVLYSRDNKSVCVINNDDIGCGGLMWILRPIGVNRSAYEDKVLGWLPVAELSLPPWVPNV